MPFSSFLLQAATTRRPRHSQIDRYVTGCASYRALGSGPEYIPSQIAGIDYFCATVNARITWIEVVGVSLVPVANRKM